MLAKETCRPYGRKNHIWKHIVAHSLKPPEVDMKAEGWAESVSSATGASGPA